MAKLIGAVDVVVLGVVVVVVLVIIEVKLLIGVDTAVVVRIFITSWRWLSVAIVIIPAMHVATNITNQIMILQVCFGCEFTV